MFKKSFFSGTNLLIDNIVDKVEGLGSRLASDIIIIGVIISENNKLQNVGNVNMATSYKIFYAQSFYAQSCFPEEDAAVRVEQVTKH
jgi:hypothetical protein